MNKSADGNEPRSTRRQATRWDTQDAAWTDIQPRLGTLNALVLDAITQQPGTCDELEIRLSLTHQTCSACVNSLMNDGLIVADGKRPTRSGRAARVWTLPIPTTLFERAT
jgi:hypothetical protein